MGLAHAIRRFPRGIGVLALLAGLLSGLSEGGHAEGEAGLSDPEHGKYVFQLAGCLGCHTDSANGGEVLAGGRALELPFGTFITPNITPDPVTGIGTWSLRDFILALREGLSPDGDYYYPAFPFDHYTQMSDGDVAALYGYLMARPAVTIRAADHDLAFPFNIRQGLVLWRTLYFEPGPRPDDSLSPELARGRYLTDALSHCGACHTPRTLLGGPIESLYLAGNPHGPEGDSVPNITPDPTTGLGNWTDDDLGLLVKVGVFPDGDVVSGSMAEVVREGTRHLSDNDLAAMLAWLRHIPPVENDPKP